MSQMQPPIQPPLAGLKPHRATTILVLGILSLVLCQICGVFAWIMGNRDLDEMDAGRMDPSGRGMTQAGKICGMIATLILCFGALVWLVILVIVGVAGIAGAVTGGGP